MPSEKRMVVFLGAGASRALNSISPLDADLLDAIIRRLSQNYRREYDQLMGFLGKYFGGRHSHLWDVLLFLHEHQGQGELKHVLEIVESQISGVASTVMNEGSFGLYSWATESMMDQLLSFPLKIDFISTNYDLVLDGNISRDLNRFDARRWSDEREGKLIGYQNMYGVGNDSAWFSKRRGREIVLDDGTRDIEDECVLYLKKLEVGTGSHDGREAKLVKLHGSVNWSFCSRCGDVHLISTPAVQYVLSQPKFPVIPGDHSLERMLTTPWEIQAGKGEGKHVIFRRIRDECLRLLSEADLLVFVGYSLPPEDRHVRMMISEANCRYRETGGSRQVVVVDKGDGKEIRNRYRSLFSPAEMDLSRNFHSKGLVEFIEENGFSSLKTLI